ncbi:phospholipase A2 inhibitor and Ly6/PLAUR domain-containing protein-like [Pelodytes ibericus]
MSSALTVLCLLASVLGSAFSLECVHCSSNTSNPCTGTKKVCATGQDQCISVYTESNIQSDKLMSYSSSCGVSKDCNQMYRMTFNHTSQYKVTKCCNTTVCNPVRMNFEEKKEKNSVTCPYCNEKNDKCKTTVPVQCMGDEKECLTYSYQVLEAGKNVTRTVKGCATKNLCEKKPESIFLGNEMFPLSVDCNGASSILSSLLLPSVSGVLFLKLLS